VFGPSQNIRPECIRVFGLVVSSWFITGTDGLAREQRAGSTSELRLAGGMIGGVESCYGRSVYRGRVSVAIKDFD